MIGKKFNPFTKKPDYIGDEEDYLKLDQTTPQTVTGQPTFDGGIKVINGFIILNE